MKHYQEKTIKLKDLLPNEWNPNVTTTRQQEAILESLDGNKQILPLLVRKFPEDPSKYQIIDGEHRYLASKQLGLDELICWVIDVDDVTAKKLTIQMNETRGQADPEQLAELLNELQESLGEDLLKGLPYTQDDLDEMLAGLVEGIELNDFNTSFDSDNEDDVPEVENVETRVKLGDIWQLGNHLLLCGDCTVENNIRKLLVDNKIELLFTSPPYSDMRTYEEGTDVSISKLNKIFLAWNDYVNYFAINLGLKFKDSEVVEYWQEWITEARNQGLKLLAWNVWDKTIGGSIASATNMFLLTHEWIFVFGESKKKLNRIIPNQLDKYEARHGKDFLKGLEEKRIRQQDGSIGFTKSATYTHHQLHSVIQQTPELGKIRENHPATMPVGLPQQYIESMTNENDLVADPFLGSGTTLIACEKTNRVCFGTELSEKYCDVIVQRWENLTGKKGKFVRNING